MGASVPPRILRSGDESGNASSAAHCFDSVPVVSTGISPSSAAIGDSRRTRCAARAGVYLVSSTRTGHALSSGECRWRRVTTQAQWQWANRTGARHEDHANLHALPFRAARVPSPLSTAAAGYVAWGARSHAAEIASAPSASSQAPPKLPT